MTSAGFAFPRELSLEVDCFGPEMIDFRHADSLCFDTLRRKVTPRFADGPTLTCHF